MIIEETGESPACPICSSDESCSHRVAVLDHTFLECTDGALFDRTSEFSELIESRFAEFIEIEASPKDISGEIEAMWKYAKECFDPASKNIEIDSDALYRLMNELLEEAGATSIQAISEGGPGMSSSLSILYAEDPEKVIQEATSRLSAILAS
jgi:hypothetical protein